MQTAEKTIALPSTVGNKEIICAALSRADFWRYKPGSNYVVTLRVGDRDVEVAHRDGSYWMSGDGEPVLLN